MADWSPAWTLSALISATWHSLCAGSVDGRQRHEGGAGSVAPLLTETGAQRIGKAIVGTVKGDIHDIGKNLVAMMLEGAGFEVVNLGINVDADTFLKPLKSISPTSWA